MPWRHELRSLLFFFNDTATTEIYTLSLHDALPICLRKRRPPPALQSTLVIHSGLPGIRPIERRQEGPSGLRACFAGRSEEHTSELQSHLNLVCRLLLEKKKKRYTRKQSSQSLHPSN